MAKKKLLNYDIENEQAVLSAMMKSAIVRKRLVIELSTADFIAQRHKIIFNGLVRMVEKRLKFSVDTLAACMPGKDFGGSEYLVGVRQNFNVQSDSIDFHTDKLRNDSFKATLKADHLLELEALCDDPASSLADIEETVGKIHTAARKHQRRKSAQILKGQDAIDAYNEHVQRRESTDFRGLHLLELDERLTEGFAPGLVSIIAARPSIGKSTVMNNVARKLAVRKVSVLNGTLETHWSAAVDTMICSVTGIEYDRYMKAPDQLTPAEKKKIERAKQRILGNEFLHFWKPDHRTLDALENEIASEKYDVVFLDQFENLLRSLEQAEIAMQLKRVQSLAQNYDVHICLIHQLISLERSQRRSRKDKRPVLDDLKNSGGYEEAADLVLLLHRDKYYAVREEGENDDVPDIIEFWIAKQRRGAINVCVPFEFDAACGKIGAHVTDWLPWALKSEDLKEGVL